APRQWLDVEHNVAELPMAAGLLLVPSPLDHRFLDGLAIADSWLAGRDGDAEAVGEPLGRNPQMHFPLPPRNHFLRLRVVHDTHRGILLDQLVQRLSEFDVVFAFLGRNRDSEDGCERWYLDQLRVRLLAHGKRIA